MRWQKQIKSTLLYNNMCRRDGRHQSNWGVHLFALRDWVHHQRNIHWILPHGGNRKEVFFVTWSKLRLDPAKIVGLCFDGAANMSGIHRGLAALMIERCSPQALYVQCHAHLLNLAIQDTMSGILPCEILWAPSRRFTISWRPAQSAMLSSIASNTREHL